MASKAESIYTAYDNIDKIFPKKKIINTGNPVRQDLLTENKNIKSEAYKYFNLSDNKKTLLIIGGSLGAKTINESIALGLENLINNNIQIIWQTGKNYFSSAEEEVKKFNSENIKVLPFISRMDLAYSIADVVISRAGASSISELCLLEKPAILVPSPNVAEDHQTKNALALSEKNAAIVEKDKDSKSSLTDTVIRLLNNEKKLFELSENIAKLAKHNSSQKIAQIVIEAAEKSRSNKK